MSNYYVIKRNDTTQDVSFDKIQNRLKSLSNNLDVDTTLVSQKVISGIYPGISTQELDVLASEVSVSMSTSHPDYKILAGKIIISNHQKQTNGKFSENMTILNNAKPMVLDPNFYELVLKYKDFLDELIDYERDFLINFFGFKTLEKAYLLKSGKKIIERPQDMWLRVA